MNFSELFIDKSKTLIINTELAVILGDLNESIVLNQLNYWLEINKKANKHFIDGRFWVYNTYNDWKEENFQYWSEKTIQRTFTRLENKGIVISANYNKSGIDKTKWYTIDYDKLEEIVNLYREEHDNLSQQHDNLSQQQDNMSTRQDKMTCPSGQSDRAIPENTTDITNRDYHSENRVISPTELNTNEFASSPTGLHTSLSDERKARGKSKDKWVVTKNHIVSVMDKLGYGELADETQSAIEIFRYYYMMYKQKTGKAHQRLNDKAMTDTLVNFIDSLSEIDCIDYDDYEYMIDEHFSNNYGKEIDWSIRHFMNIGILKKLYARII